MSITIVQREVDADGGIHPIELPVDATIVHAEVMNASKVAFWVTYPGRGESVEKRFFTAVGTDQMLLGDATYLATAIDRSVPYMVLVYHLFEAFRNSPKVGGS